MAVVALHPDDLVGHGLQTLSGRTLSLLLFFVVVVIFHGNLLVAVQVLAQTRAKSTAMSDGGWRASLHSALSWFGGLAVDGLAVCDGDVGSGYWCSLSFHRV